MSWQSYVDNQIRSRVQCKFAVIAGLEDGSIWAKYEEDPKIVITQAELKVLADGLQANPSKFREGGLRVGGESYICLYDEPSLLRGRKGNSALIAVATNKCLIVVATVDGFPPGQLNVAVESLGDYLRGNNF